MVPEKWTTATKNIPAAGCAPALSCHSPAAAPWSLSGDELLAATNLMARQKLAQFADILGTFWHVSFAESYVF
jgi:hypothetical protein